ncbi:MAG: hypothetical protein RR685_09365, partial [Hungatella sp.]
RKDIVDYIQVGLQKDCPIAMLIGRNHCMDLTKITYPDGSGWLQQRMSYHWVTITAMAWQESGSVILKVSTWGGYAYLDLDDWLAKAGWPQAMVYIES